VLASSISEALILGSPQPGATSLKSVPFECSVSLMK